MDGMEEGMEMEGWNGNTEGMDGNLKISFEKTIHFIMLSFFLL